MRVVPDKITVEPSDAAKLAEVNTVFACTAFAFPPIVELKISTDLA